MVEGGQGAIVGLGPVHEDYFKESHPLAHKCTSLVHKGDNLDRYLLGRQFMVILIVFTTEMAGAPLAGAELWGLPTWLTNMMLATGIAMILFTCMVGQLNSEINGCHCMLDYINTWFAVFTVWVAMAIEFSGVLHICYIIQKVVAQLAGQPIESKEPPKSFVQHLFFYGRAIMSLAILCFSFAVTMTALFNGQTTMWEFMPPVASVVLFFVLLFVIGLLEGSQIAYFAVVKMRDCERGEGFFAKKSCEILFVNDNRNLGRFIIGRQLLVVSCMFIIARITSVKLKDDEPNLFGVSDSTQGLFSTGLLGAHIVAVIGSVTWRLLSSAFPLAFLASPLTYILLRVALFLEWTGVLHGAFVLAFIHKKIAGFQRDEVYIGTAEERAAQSKRDRSSIAAPKAGHIVPIVETGENPFEGPTTVEEIEDLEEELKERLEALKVQKKRLLEAEQNREAAKRKQNSDLTELDEPDVDC
ncbi:expressed unknown protein [Seminavis robusta]|uniref:Silicon transporter n=1 Tax=Seminavis robusta TaxID=568900 RepID=A0A9N8D8A7_9STRA|nr:expressed unknown protein [Seminavis robusta]|eukprot:Sro1_g000280.1 n/a (470) ;mRNA; r:84125-85705